MKKFKGMQKKKHQTKNIFCDSAHVTIFIKSKDTTGSEKNLSKEINKNKNTYQKIKYTYLKDIKRLLELTYILKNK